MYSTQVKFGCNPCIFEWRDLIESVGNGSAGCTIERNNDGDEVLHLPVKVLSLRKLAWVGSNRNVSRRTWKLREYLRTNKPTGLDYGVYARGNGDISRLQGVGIQEERELDGSMIYFLHEANKAGAFYEAAMPKHRVGTKGAFKARFGRMFGTGNVLQKENTTHQEKVE